jgi:thioredoxin 1
MKNNLRFIILLLVTLFGAPSLTLGQSWLLNSKGFKEKLAATSEKIIVDVRTPEEYKGGYIDGALNINWNDPSFKTQAARLDKEQPLFVYCLSGGRSAAAANELRKMGFSKVYELEGGVMKWNATGYELVKSSAAQKKTGMSLKEYENLVSDKRKVLVDFYAPWCAPCKKMKPYIEDIKANHGKQVKVVEINADEHPQLMKELNIDAIPVIIVVDKSKEVWRNQGFTEKETMLLKLGVKP